MGAAEDEALVEVLTEARDLGFLGPGPVEPHIAHARGFAAACDGSERPFRAGNTGSPRGEALDLGSGGGVPGLPLALAWPSSRWALLDSGSRRGAFLRDAACRLGVEHRVRVIVGRAEDLAHRPDLRGSFGLVVARGFGPPAVTAECAAGFLRVDGRLIVSEPPEPDPARWPPGRLGDLGLRPGPAFPALQGRSGPASEAGEAHFRVIEVVAPCPDRYPRRVGVPTKRPLF